MYKKGDVKFLLATGYSTRARTKAEATRKGRKHLGGSMPGAGFVMIEDSDE